MTPTQKQISFNRGASSKCLSVVQLLCLCTALAALANPDGTEIARALGSLNKSNLQKPRCSQMGPEHVDVAEQWRRAGFGVPIVRSLEIEWPDGTPAFTHEISFTMVLFRDTGWTIPEIRQRYAKVAQIYSQCGIKVATAKLVIVNAPNPKWVDVDFSSERRDLKIAQKVPPTQKPILFYVRKSLDGEIAYSWPKIRGVEPDLTDTVWMTAEANSNDYKKSQAPDYNDDAHELAHIYGDCGHNKDSRANILHANPDMSNGDFLPEQCERMKKHPLVRPLRN